MRIDPHTHSRCSDGTDTPSELIAAAAAAQLDIVGITDHDTVAGWDEAADAARTHGIGLLRGTEFSCADNGRTVHMLGYLFDPTDLELNQLMQKTRRSREERIREFTRRLAKDYPITLDDVLAQVPAGAPAGRPHIADALVAAGCFPNRDAVFQKVLHPTSKYYVRLWSADVRDVLAKIRQAGGVAVYAHPRATKRQRLVPTRVLVELARNGLFAFEAAHRDHTAEMRTAVETIAAYCGIATTGSSDYHGKGKRNRLGENLTSVQVARELIAAGQLELIGATL